MRKLGGIFAVALTALVAAATPAQAEVLVNETFPVSFTVFNPCALGGVGEEVLVTGDQQALFRVTENENNRSVTALLRTKATGTGLVSGDTYQVIDVRLPDPFKVSLENGQANGRVNSRQYSPRSLSAAATSPGSTSLTT